VKIEKQTIFERKQPTKGKVFVETATRGVTILLKNNKTTHTHTHAHTKKKKITTFAF